MKHSTEFTPCCVPCAGSQSIAGSAQGSFTLSDPALVGVVVASLITLFILIIVVAIYVRWRFLGQNRARPGLDSSKFVGSSKTASLWGTAPRERPSLVFPPLEVAERGIDLDMENLFKTAGANSDNSQESLLLQRLDSNGAVELPQAFLYATPNT